MRKMTFGKGKPLSRRKFIVGSAAIAGGGLALGLNVPFAHGQPNGAANEVNVWVAIQASRLAATSRASAPGAIWAPAAAKVFASRRTTSGAAGLRRA